MDKTMQGTPVLEHQAIEDWDTATGLPRAVDEWRAARRQCQLTRSNETIGRYCGATDELARALLGDFAAEPGSQAVFERFWYWLAATEAEP